MRILLLGEYSNVHATLAQGFRKLGHEVTVASNGDFWKNYDRDIDLSRRQGKAGGIRLAIKIIRNLKHFRGYDIVQLINPMFVEVKAERIFPLYKYLRKHNNRVVLCAMGMDYYWVNSGTNIKPLRYSDFNFGDQLRTNKDAIKERKDWLGTQKEALNRMIASDCDSIICGLYEYWIAYKDYFVEKTHFIPLPIIPLMTQPQPTKHLKNKEVQKRQGKLKVFIGINKERSEYKGTDIMLQAARDILYQFPQSIDLKIAENIPFNEYKELMKDSDVILDQLYSYTPSMNSLEAMNQGLICVGGGEPENYEILKDTDLKPIINVLPTYHSVYKQLLFLIQHPTLIDKLKKDGKEYINRYHDYMKIAANYLHIYENLLRKKTAVKVYKDI